MTATNAVPVHSSNAEQLRAWDGDEGAYWAEHADYFDRSVTAYHEQLFATAAITSADRVLDIGCGTGQTTRDAARAAAEGSALGVDLSARMLEVARRRAAEEGVTNGLANCGELVGGHEADLGVLELTRWPSSPVDPHRAIPIRTPPLALN